MSHSQQQQQQQRHNNMVERFGAKETSDTTYTKIFVGGLAWETQKETMKQYFEQFGEILEAVVIKDKSTGKSKGYGFVTFKDPESAWRACQDPYPIIDGRRANCNLAAFGAQKNRSSLPQQGLDKLRQRSATMASSSFEGTSTYLHHNTMPHRGYAYSTYGYPGYSHDLAMNYYNIYGGQQYPSYYPSAMGSPGFYLNYYPFYNQLGQSSSAAQQSKFTHYPLWSHPYRALGVPMLPSSTAPPFPATPASRPITATVAATTGLTANDTEQKTSNLTA